MARKRTQSRIFSIRRKKYHLVNAKLSRKKKRKKKSGSQHVLRMMTLAIIVIACGLGGYQLWQFVKNSPVFQISEVSVSGKETFSKEEIVELGGLKRKMNFFDVSVKSIEKKLEQVPAIKNATVIKDLNSIRLAIEERRPLATVKDGKEEYFIDEWGVVFSPRGSYRSGDLPHIKRLKNEKLVAGQKCKNWMIFKALDILRLHRDNELWKLFKIDTVEIKPRGDIILWAGAGPKVMRGVRIELGNKNFKQRMEYLASTLRSRREPVRKYVDLRGKKPFAN